MVISGLSNCFFDVRRFHQRVRFDLLTFSSYFAMVWTVVTNVVVERALSFANPNDETTGQRESSVFDLSSRGKTTT